MGNTISEISKLQSNFKALNRAVAGSGSYADVNPIEVPDEPSLFSKIFRPTKSKEICKKREQALDFNKFLRIQQAKELIRNEIELKKLQNAYDKPIEISKVNSEEADDNPVRQPKLIYY